MSVYEDSIIDSLKKLGLTPNEAKIFIYIVKNPNSNGYEISKHTGISRSLVYGALEKLRNNGILELTQSNSSSYLVKPIEEIQSTIEREISSAVLNLKDKLTSIQTETTSELFITIPDRENQIEKMSYLIKTAKKHLYISAGMRELDWIREDLLKVDNSINVHIFSLANLENFPDHFKTYSKNMAESFIQSQKKLKNRWRIMMIKDEEEMILCGGEETTHGAGIYTKNRMMVQFAVEHFIHDVKIFNIESNYDVEDNTHEEFSHS